MSREGKSPQEKKTLEYTKDHFTFGYNSSRALPRIWKRKKAHANRKYRRKSAELLTQAKPGVNAEGAELVAGELTAVHLKQSISRKRLLKHGTVSLGEKIKIKLAKRNEMIGRRAYSHRHYDQEATFAIHILTALEGEKLADAISQASLLCHPGNHEERFCLSRSKDDLNRALTFFVNAHWGHANERDALRRNQKLCMAFQHWVEKANCMLNQPKLNSQKKIEEQQLIKNKVRALRAGNQSQQHD